MVVFKKYVSFCGAICLIISCVVAENVASISDTEAKNSNISFTEFYHKVLAYYPKIKHQKILVELSNAKKQNVSSAYLPFIKGSVSVANGNDPVFVFGSLLHEASFKESNFEISSLNKPASHTTTTLSLGGELSLFDAFQTILAVRSASALVNAARNEESFVRKEILLICVEAYLNVMTLEQIETIVKKIKEESQFDIQQAEDLRAKGLVLGADFYLAKVMFGGIEKALNEITMQKKLAYMILNILMGECVQSPLHIKERLPLNYHSVSISMEDLLKKACSMREDYLALKCSIDSSRFELEKTKNSWLPRIYAFGEARRDSSDFVSDGGESYIVGIRLTMDLFDPSYYPRRRIAKYMLSSEEQKLAILKDKITKDIVQAYQSYEMFCENLKTLQKMCNDTKQTIEFMLPLYREGKKSIADLMQSRVNCLQIHSDYIRTISEVIASEFRLSFLSGTLNEKDIENNSILNDGYNKTKE